MEDSVPTLSIKEVSSVLAVQYAILSGGKSSDGHPIITFPDGHHFTDVLDDDLKKVLQYLTSVPPLQESDAGFVLVIDRRLDKWNSVKSTLLKISYLFPGLIHVAYVVRPAGFLQKAISEVTSKFYKDEFKFQVVICNNVEDLHCFLPENELTTDLEGNLTYDNDEWITQRTALEEFTTNTNNMSVSLRNFSKGLQETDLPNDVLSTSNLLKLQLEEYETLHQNIKSSLLQGESLLSSVRTINVNHPCRILNGSAIERLIVQLEETEASFLMFWRKHESRLNQCLELRKFEQDFCELQICFDDNLSQLTDMTEVGDNVNRVETLIKEIRVFQEQTAEDLERAEELRSYGAELILKQHYAVDSIQPKCVELQRMCDTYRQRLQKRIIMLQKHREIQERIEKINRWCTGAVEMLASQQVEGCNTSECAVLALQEVEAFLTYSRELQLDPDDLRTTLEAMSTPESRALIQQVLKRVEDILLMCDKRKSSLKKMTKKPSRPVQSVHPVISEPASPLQDACYEKETRERSSSLTNTPHADHKSPKLWQRKISHPKLLPDAGDLCSSKFEPGDVSSPESEVSVRDPETLKVKQSHVISELLDTERAYVGELDCILRGYKDQMINPQMQQLIPQQLESKADILFGNMEEIHRFHGEIFLSDLENCTSTPELIGLCFVQRKEVFYKLYSQYCLNKPKSEELRRTVGDANTFFLTCQRQLGHKLPLGAYLLKPVQRITKYQLLLKELLHYCDEENSQQELQEAVTGMLKVLKCVNDSLHQVDITGFPGSISKQGKLLMQGQFSIYSDSRKDKLRLKPMQRHLFLYEKCLIFCKKVGKDSDSAAYLYKHSLRMSQVGLTENVHAAKGESKKFEVWLQGRQEVHTIQAPTLEVKAQWVKQIKKVLIEQFEILKGESQRQYSARMSRGNSVNGVKPSVSPPSVLKSRQSVLADTDNGDGNKRCRVFSSDSCSSKLEPACEEEEDWSNSELSNSEDEDPFSDGCEPQVDLYLCLSDYNAVSDTEVTLSEGEVVSLVRVGCAGWWFVKAQDPAREGWAPASYLQSMSKKSSHSTLSISSQSSHGGNSSQAGGLTHATSKCSVASSGQDQDLGCPIESSGIQGLS